MTVAWVNGATGHYCYHCLSFWLSVLASLKLLFTTSWTEGASSPQYTPAYQPQHLPTALLFFFSPFWHPLCSLWFSPHVKRQIKNSSDPLSQLICLSQSACLAAALQAVVRQAQLPFAVAVMGPGDQVVMGKGDRSFVGDKDSGRMGKYRVKGGGINACFSLC